MVPIWTHVCQAANPKMKSIEPINHYAVKIEAKSWSVSEKINGQTLAEYRQCIFQDDQNNPFSRFGFRDIRPTD